MLCSVYVQRVSSVLLITYERRWHRGMSFPINQRGRVQPVAEARCTHCCGHHESHDARHDPASHTFETHATFMNESSILKICNLAPASLAIGWRAFSARCTWLVPVVETRWLQPAAWELADLACTSSDGRSHGGQLSLDRANS
jgi:hypothetical protein